ncbi:MAG: MBL fold metallo-hydrolase [Nocardioidaceae bacterium]
MTAQQGTCELAATWWGHSSVSVVLGGVTVATDPLLTRRLLHLTRTGPLPTPAALQADLVVVSHLHLDHLHLPSLRRFPPGTPIVVPRGAVAAVPQLRELAVVEVDAGETVEVAGMRVEALVAQHDGRRHNWARRDAPALGFRLSAGRSSCWYSGDTGVHDEIDAVQPVDLALVAIGGWGPTLGEGHLDPEQAAGMVARVGATWALPVHYGTFWPVVMRRVRPDTHRRLFVTPPERFLEAVAAQGVQTIPVVPALGEPLDLAG